MSVLAGEEAFSAYFVHKLVKNCWTMIKHFLGTPADFAVRYLA